MANHDYTISIEWSGNAMFPTFTNNIKLIYIKRMMIINSQYLFFWKILCLFRVSVGQHWLTPTSPLPIWDVIMTCWTVSSIKNMSMQCADGRANSCYYCRRRHQVASATVILAPAASPRRCRCCCYSYWLHLITSTPITHQLTWNRQHAELFP